MQLLKYMIIILPMIAFLVLFIWNLKAKVFKIVEFIFLIPLFIVVTILFNVMLFITFVKDNTEVISQTKAEYSLVSTKFGSATDGSFFLGTGTINNEEYMYYVIRDGDEIKRNKTQNYKIYITNEDPYVVMDKKTIKESWTNWFYKAEFWEDVYEEEGTCVFYVPEDSIVQSININ